MKSSVYRCFSLATVLQVALFMVTCRKADAGKVKMIFVFGDSTADVGNNNYLPGNETTKANFRHNGIDFPGGVPTGRFCNGYVGIDFLAQKLGFPMSPPSVMSCLPTTCLREDSAYGVNYASGGSGVFNATNEGVSFSTNLQIKIFEITFSILKAMKGRWEATRLISKSLFFFSTGSNDFFSHLRTTGLQDQTQNQLFVSSLASEFKQQLMKVYSLGGRRFAIYGTGLLGCIPLLKALSPTNECNQPLNLLSQAYNNATRDMLLELQSTLPGFRYSFAKTFEMTANIASTAGFSNVVGACCGNGKLNAESFCTPDANYCSDRNDYFSWDYTHPTQAAYKLFNDLAYYGGRDFTFPINFKQLAFSV